MEVMRAVRQADAAAALPWRSVRLREKRAAYLLEVALLAALYTGVAHIGYAVGFAGAIAAIAWLPVGVGAAFLYFRGLALWPGVLAGDLLVNQYHALHLASAVGQTVGNVLETVVIALIIRRFADRGRPLDRIRSTVVVLVAIGAGTLLSAIIGPVSLALDGVIATSTIPEVARTWWLGDAAGCLVVLPLALAWFVPAERGERRHKPLETSLLFAAVVFGGELALRSHRPLTYLVFPSLIWAALRYGQRVATAAVAISSFLALWNTVHYVGPFAYESITRSDLSTQLFIAVSAITTLLLAAASSERRSVAHQLTASRVRLIESADDERRRLERNLHDGAQQRLIALSLFVDQARAAPPSSPSDTAGVLDDISRRLDDAVESLRQLAHGIHPVILTDLGIAPAVAVIAAESTVPIELVRLPSRRFEPAVEATTYYVVVEALTNAQRHADA